MKSMRHIVVLILCLVAVLTACSSTKPDGLTTMNNEKTETRASNIEKNEASTEELPETTSIISTETVDNTLDQEEKSDASAEEPPETTSKNPTETVDNTLDQEEKSDASAEEPPETTSKTPTDTVDNTLEHIQVLQMLYDEIPVLCPLARTCEFWNEYTKHIPTYLDNLKFGWVDPFSERMLPVDTPDQIIANQLCGDVIEQYGYPNFGMSWVKGIYDGFATKDFEMHSFWFLEDGTLMRVVFDGRSEFGIKYGAGTTTVDPFNTGGQYYINYYVKETSVLTVEELLNLKEFYESTAIAYGYESTEKLDPRDDNIWLWEDWPEVFVEKYGIG